MGTKLVLPREGNDPEVVWPPTPLETQLGYKRRDKLVSPDLKATEIIRNVLCIGFYDGLLDQLDDFGFTTDGNQKRLVLFPYDWRRDLFTIAALLREQIAEAHATGATRVTLVAHSMGGLVARLVLEDPDAQAQPWFATIDQFIAIATPHLGAPLALARILGCDSAMGISGPDFAWIANQIAYPSAYQLLPAPGDNSCWDQSSLTLDPLDIYDAATSMKLNLNLALLARAQAVHTVLDAGHKPAAVRYFYFAATGHRTVTRVNMFADADGQFDLSATVVTRTDDAGDGTVPLPSALPVRGQHHVAINEHSTAFKGTPFHHVFARLLGVNSGYALEAVEQITGRLSVEAPVVPAGTTIEVLLTIVSNIAEDARLASIVGVLVLTQVRHGENELETEIRRMTLRYEGPRLGKLQLLLEPIDEPGHYVLRFEGEPIVRDEVAFSVCGGTADGG